MINRKKFGAGLLNVVPARDKRISGFNSDREEQRNDKWI
jgi:hypothetical protein